jgi:glycosyltransferase involved in cell wall biosynthesis
LVGRFVSKRRKIRIIVAEPSRNQVLPRSLLYSTASGIGGSGLDQVAHESLLAAHRAGFLGRAIAFSNRQIEIPKSKIENLAAHPVKLLSFLDRDFYVGAKKHALDRATARRVASGQHDLLHAWSGDCLESLRAANRLGIPAVLEIPTWHRNKGKIKPDITHSERLRDAARFPRGVLNRLLVTRQQVMEEYARADLLLVLSQKAKETFLVAGIPEDKLFLTSRGVDVEQFTPAPHPPARFRAVFVGSLIRRKGVHLLIEAWKNLRLPDAELVLVGSPSSEIAPLLRDAPPSISVRGFVRDVAGELREASVHILPSECEGSAKVTYEASACGLAQITTRESGDVIVDGETGLIIPPNDANVLSEAILSLYRDPDRTARLGAAGRRRVVNHFTWDHFRSRLLDAYSLALNREIRPR